MSDKKCVNHKTVFRSMTKQIYDHVKTDRNDSNKYYNQYLLNHTNVPYGSLNTGCYDMKFEHSKKDFPYHRYRFI